MADSSPNDLRKPAKCCVCSEKTSEFIRLPYNQKKRRQWNIALAVPFSKRSVVQFKAGRVLCLLHFRKEDIIRGQKGRFLISDGKLPLRAGSEGVEVLDGDTSQDSGTDHPDVNNETMDEFSTSKAQSLNSSGMGSFLGPKDEDGPLSPMEKTGDTIETNEEAWSKPGPPNSSLSGDHLPLSLPDEHGAAEPMEIGRSITLGTLEETTDQHPGVNHWDDPGSVSLTQSNFNRGSKRRRVSGSSEADIDSSDQRSSKLQRQESVVN